MITAKNLKLAISNNGIDQSILNGVDFKIPQGRITFFLGKSGAGKTSLMKCIAQLTPAYQGSILWNDTDIKSLCPKERARHLGFVSQHFNLFPHLTVLGNCTNALINVFGLKQPEAEKKASEKLALVEMTAFEKSYPNQLSGGQQQRASIARALCLDPQLLLFDEPTSALDPENSASLQLVIKNLLEKGITIAIASHDMTFVKGLLDRVYFLENGNVAEFYDKKTNELDSCPLIKTFLNV